MTVDHYEGLSEDALRARLKVAEDVCTFYGWCAVRDQTERDQATLQMWTIWHSMVGSDFTNPENHPDLVRMEPMLAAARRAKEAATVKAIERMIERSA